MNSKFDGGINMGNLRLPSGRQLARLSRYITLALLLLAGARSGQLMAANHGAGIFKTPLGPPPTFSSKAHVGDIITATLSVRDLDSFNDSLTITSVVDIVFHGLPTGVSTSANLLLAPITLTNLYDPLNPNNPGSRIITNHSYTVLPGDPEFLLDNAIAGGRDNHDGLNGTFFPQNFQITFPGQIQILRPCIAVTKTCVPPAGPGGVVTYIGSISNCGNAPLSGVLVSNLVNGAYTYVLGPTTLDTNQVITFTNSYMAIDPCNPVTDTLWAWGTDELSLTVSNSATATCPLISTNAPVLACQPNKTVECGASWTFDPPTVTNRGSSTNVANVVVTVISTVTNTGCGLTFVATRTWLATDTCGNTNTCSQTVTVRDTTPPTITCVGPKTVECTTPWNFDAPTASDTCGTATIAILATTTNATGFCGNTFAATRTWRATDSCGNTSTCTQMVTVVDTTVPTIACVPNKTVECTTPWNFDAPTASDTCGTNAISIIGTITNTAGFCGNTFAATRTWRATDACGNTATCTQMVTVVDTTAPTITCVPNKTVECTVPWTFNAPTASDTCGTNVITIVGTVTNISGFCGNTFAATRTWRATDACGNSSTCTQMVTVVDTTAPVITCVPNKSVECTTPWNFDQPTASDTCGATSVGIVGTITNIAGFCGNTFAATRTWRATDACGNTSTCTQMVTVVDTTAPTITCVPNKSVECTTPWNFDAPAASDTCGAATISIVGTATNLAGFCGNTFAATRTWRATDACGNSSTCTQMVTVVDTTAPTITCVPNKNVECTTPWNFDPPTASDTCGTASISIVGTVTNITGFCGNTFAATRTWRATDSCGNTATCTQMVTVVDTTAPTITCVPNKTVECPLPWTFDAPTASDTCGNATISILGTVTNTAGFCGNTFAATRTWRATDACGNTATCTQMVTVVDTTAPTITCVGNKSVECTTPWSFDQPTASDTCGATSVGILGTVTNITGFCGNTFSATRTWRATDSCGNTSTCTQMVTVVDTTAPTITCVPNKSVECTTPWNFDAPTASDTCGAANISIVGTVTNLTGFCGNTFAATRTWRATDACGNSSTCTQMVTVVDTTAPTITCVPNKAVECTAIWNFDAPTASDTCGNATISIVGTVTNLTGFCGNTFAATRTWRATDSCGNTATCTQMVTVVDTTPPTITCVPNKSVECTSLWNFDPPTASDTCGTASISTVGTVTNISGFCGNTFAATRTWRATDACGNTATCTQMVTVVDTTAPTITCVPAKTVECNSNWNFDGPTASDTCGGASISIVSTTTNIIGFCGNTFSATRTWRATDACGNIANCSQTVTVVDTTPPTIVCVPNKSVECTTPWNFDPPTASDTCGSATVSILGTVTNSAGFCGNTFAATRTWRALDACGNSSTCTQMVTVVDTTAPTITCVPNKMVECNSAWNFDSPTASDTCGGVSVSITGTTTNISGFCGNTFSATRTWRATDACGNFANCSQTVTVIDTTPPVINCVGNKSVECTAPWNFDQPTASDTCGSVSVAIVGTTTNIIGFCGNTFSATRTWRATDACGNFANCSQTVTVVDTTAPVITCVPNKSVECTTPWNFDQPTASDTCGNATINVVGTVTNNVGFCGNTFAAVRTWRALDACGNSSTCTQMVTVVDTTAPTITCVPNKMVECNSAWNFDSPTASDTCGGVSVSITGTTTNISGFCGNTFSATRTWRATDACGNIANCSQTVTVIDTTPPVINCVGNKSVECTTPWNFDQPTASDTCGSVSVAVVATTTNIIGFCGNTFSATRTWRATDSCGNIATCFQTVTVVDTTAPVITCVPNKSVECTTPWNFDQPTASDTCGNATINVVGTVTNNVGFCGNTFAATRTWRALDACGNSSTCTQMVTVVDTTVPTITCVPNKMVECNSSWNFDQPTASDTCGGVSVSITGTTTNISGFCGNTFSATRTWRATDACGNIANCSQTVTVIDTTPPVINCVGNKSVECTTPWNFDQPTASDTCGSVSVAVVGTTTNIIGFCGNTFSATRTWRATDSCGNIATCFQTVTVVDTTAPVITCVPNKSVECPLPWNFDPPTASDTCGNAVISIVGTVTNTAGFCGNTFSATRTWRATDSCGNTATCTQMVTVVDTTAPTITCVPNKTVECPLPWSFDSPTASDTCGNATISVLGTVTNTAGFCGSTFAATRTWRATDACGNTSTCTQMVTVVDTTAPVIVCVPNKAVECNSTWNFDAPSASDTCGAASISILGTLTNITGFCGNTFSATRTWRATDACGNSSTCTQMVTVVDTTAPVIVCVTNKTVECTTTWNFDAPTAADTCGNATVSILGTVTNSAGFCGNTFAATRTWRAIDACGNSSTCTQMVTVVDRTAPVITCVPNKTVECTAPWSFDQPTASDTCGAASVAVLGTVTNANGFCGNTFAATRTWRATDACGNTSTCTQMVTVVDTTAPTITCVPGKTVECNAPWNFDQPTASDTCGAASISIVGTLTNISGFCGNTFSATRTWRATDVCGNSSTCTQMVTVVDTTAPTITCVPGKTVECTTPWSFDPPAASDTCGTATISIVGTLTNSSGFCGNTFAATRTWRATDACGNSATCTQMVTVVDSTAPVINCARAKTFECGTAWTFDVPTASDTCGTNSISILSTVTNILCGNALSATRTWRAIDACGNTSTCTQMVTIVDTTPPILIGVPLNASYQCLSEVPPAPPVIATNSCAPNTALTLRSSTNGTCPLYITNFWVAVDSCSNSASAVQVIQVQDTMAPMLIGVPTNQTFGCLRDVLPPPTVRAIDNCATNMVVKFSSSTNGFRPTFIINCWTVTDGCTNTTTACQTNTVLDIPAAIGDFVWEDKNLNGIQDAGEPGISNATVNLLDCSNNLLATTTTDGGGLYLFTNLLCGNYVVQFVNPDPIQYQFTLQHQGADPAKDSDPDPLTGKTTCIVLNSGETNRTIDGGFKRIDCKLAVSKTACVMDLPGAGTNCVTTFSDSDCVRVRYTYTVSNIGLSPINNITVNDDQLGPVPGSPIATLAPGQSVILYATNNSVCCSSTNTVTVSANDRCSASATASVTVTKCNPLQSCTVSYPFASANPLTSVPFNESEVLRAFAVSVSNGCAPTYIRAYYNDEHALTMGVRQVVVKTASGSTTNNYAITAAPATPTSVLNPQVGSTVLTGDQAGVDFSGRPLYPALFITDITADPSSLAGDWQFGGTAIAPHAVFGVWKSAVRTVDKTKSPATVTIQPDSDPAKNNWDLDGGDVAPPGLVNQGYGAEVRWDVAKLGLLPGHSYRLYFMVHDGDQNKSGGDVGHGCAVLLGGHSGLCTPSSALGDFVWQDLNTNGLQDAGEPGVPGATVRLLDCSSNLLNITTTDGNGRYLFNGLPAGNYMVQFVPPAGFTFTSQDAGDDSLDSDPDPVSGFTGCYNLGVGQTNLTVDAGLVPQPCRLAVSKTACVLDVPGAGTNCVTTFSESDCVRVKYIYTIVNTGSSPANNITVVDDQLGPVPGSPIASLGAGQSITLFATNNSVCCSSTNTVFVNASGQCQASAVASVTVTKCNPLQSCTVSYPFASANPLTSVPFNESEVLRAFTVSVANGCTPTQIRAFYSDEHALTLGTRQVIVKTASGSTTNNYPITASPAAPTSALNPQVGSTILTGDQAGTDLAGRPLYPALFITDITSDPSSLAGDWQSGGTAIKPDAVFGVWKSAVRIVDNTKSPAVVTIQPDVDPAKNNWNLDGGDPAPAGLVNQGYGAEIRWDVAKLGLLPGHSYRLYFMVHDGDQNHSGGDVGHGCAVLNAGHPGQCAPSGALGDFVWQDLNTNGLQDAGEPGVPGVTVRLLDCASNLMATTTTGPDGLYLFSGLLAGNYMVQFVPPAGSAFTTPLAGDGSKDSDADPLSGFTQCILLGVGQTNLTIDAGIIPSSPPPGLMLTKTADRTVAAPGGLVVFTYTVKNTGSTTATGITVTDDNGTPGYLGDDFVVGTLASLAPNATATFTVTNTLPTPMCAAVNGTNAIVGTLITQILPNGNVKIAYLQSRAINDNTYGTGSVGWSGTGHKFSDLTGSDKAQFVLYNGTGTKVLDFYVDYVSASASYPSGYGTLGVTGGDGGMNFGSASNVVSTMTTITRSLNQSSAFYGYTVNSPLPEANFPTWEYVDGYEVVVKGSAFGASGFGRVEVPLVHNSPAKTGNNAIIPTPCLGCISNIAIVTASFGASTLSDSAEAVVCLSTNLLGAIGDFVWQDLNQDGRQDAGEPGVPNVTVLLMDCGNNVLASTSTDSGGKYLFNNLPSGNYQVRFMLPPGYLFTLQNVGSDDKNSDATPLTGVTACLTLAAGQTNLNVDAGVYQASPPSVLLVKSANEPFITPGGEVIYTYVASNITGSTLTGLVVSDDNGTPGFTNDDFVVGTLASLAPHASVAFAVTNSPPTPMCMVVGGTNLNVGTLVTQKLPDGNVKVTYLQSRAVVDNTYGSGAVGWPNGHTFQQFLGSDKAQFVFYNGAGVKVLDFYADYVSASASFASGYGSLGANGGDGGMNFGSASNIVSATTTLTRSLNQDPAFFGYTVNSPLPEASFPNWDYINGYEVVVKGSIFGATGFGRVEVPLVHNSPSKLSFNAATPTPCGFCITNTAIVTAQNGLQAVSGAAQAVVCITTNRMSGLGDRVWSDINGNGVQDAGEPGVGNVTVNLLDCSGHVLRTTTTDTNGLYLFSGMVAGNYQVRFVAPAGTSFTVPDAGGNDATDSDPNVVSALSPCVSLAAGEINRTIDAGLAGVPHPILVPAPRIYWPEFLAAGHVQIRTDGPVGSSYLIESSTDLRTWTPVTTLVNATGVLDFVDPSGANAPQRFYRIMLVP